MTLQAIRDVSDASVHLLYTQAAGNDSNSQLKQLQLEQPGRYNPSKLNHHSRITIYVPMIYTAPCVMFLMRADSFCVQVGGGWALEIESFWAL